jgi:hypothetical protein
MDLVKRIADHNAETRGREEARIRHEQLHTGPEGEPRPRSCPLCGDAEAIARANELLQSGKLVRG